MPNEDKRRRLSDSTAQLSVAELMARREAETQPIPVVTDDPVDMQATIRMARPKPAQGRELHITELLRREGRASDTERGGFSVSKLVAMASGGVVLAGAVTFGASQLLSGPDERPLADVRFDARAQARASSGTAGQAIQAPNQSQDLGTTSATSSPTQAKAAPGTKQQQRPAPGTQSPSSTSESTSTPEQTVTAPSEQPSSSSAAPTTPSTPPSSTGESAPPPSSATPPATSIPPSSTPPASTTPSPGLGLEVDLGILNPLLGGFDFFAPAE